MNQLLLKLIIDGTATGAIKALVGVSTEAKKTSADLAGLGNATGLKSLEAQFQSLRTLTGQVLGFAGVSVGVSSIIQLADAYSNMTGRLRLATQYTGDFDQTLSMLRESASSTRSSLQSTVGLYVKLSPALASIGLNGAAAVGVVTTINQAVGLSGASSEAAAAALTQLAQGFGSGALRGDELNSVIEQTPALAQAIADGLGVPIGELRRLGEQGELTGEKIALALQKVGPQLEADFSKMPKTVGQALTELQNQFLVFIGQTDTATQGTSSLAQGILEVSAAFRDGAPPITAFTESIKAMVNGLDGAYRMIKIVGLGIGAYAAAAKAALSGDFSGAREIWRQLGQDIDAVLQKKLLTDRQSEQSATDSTKKRELLEAQLAVQQEKLEKAKAYIAGTTSDSIAAKDKENVDKRIADQQRLVDAVRSAWQASLAEAKSAVEKQQQLLDKAGDYRQRGKDAAFNASLKNMSPEEQAMAKSDRLSTLAGQGNYESARARVAALEGDVKKYDSLAAQAEKKLQAALSLAEEVGDATAAESIAGELAKLTEAGASLEGKKAKDAQQKAEQQAATLNDLQAKLEALKTAAREIEVKANVDDATSKIKGLEQQLAALPSEKTVTMKVVQEGSANLQTGQNGGAPGSSIGQFVADLPGRAYGGPLPGYAPHDRADNMLYRGTPGEWVIQRPAVRYWGNDFIAAINAMRLPKFAFGGQLGASSSSLGSRLAVPKISVSSVSGSTPDILDMGELGRIRMRKTSTTADDVTAVLQRAALRYGRPR